MVKFRLMVSDLVGLVVVVRFVSGELNGVNVLVVVEVLVWYFSIVVMFWVYISL